MGRLIRWLVLALVVVELLGTIAAAKKNSTSNRNNNNKHKKNSLEDDDADFGIALLDDVSATPKKDPKETNQKLADAIVRTVINFTTNNRLSLPQVVGIYNSYRPKRSTEELSFDDLLDEGESSSSASSSASPQSEDSSESNINRIPPKKHHEVLIRQAKSLDNNLLRSEQDFAAGSSAEEQTGPFDDDDVAVLAASNNLTGIENLLEVYSARRLAENWDDVKQHLGGGCRRTMVQYLRALAATKFWALKMDDASGRYSSGYYWGNGYWAGSATLCTEALPSVERKKGQMNKTESFYNGINIMDEPPFEVAFYSVKLHINSSSAIIGPNTVQLGLCLPEKCVASDIQKMIEYGGAQGNPRVIGIRDPRHNHYDMYSDLTFQLLVLVSVVVFILIVVGTSYELLLRMRIKKSLLNKMAKNHALKIDMKAVTDMPSITISNGKSIYNVNGISNNNNNSEERLNIEPLQPDEQIQLGIFSELILSFSLISNMKTICDQSVGSDTIPTIHGLRSVSMVWVILGHCCIVAFKYSDNTELRKVVEKEFLFQTVTNATFSVDTFFCISGILVSFIYFRTNAKGSLDRLTQGTRGFTSGFLQFIGLLGYRFARLTAPYLFMLGVVEVSMKWFYYNSVFDPPTEDHINCPNYWWRNVLYINTLFPVEQMCMLWSWYLADDSQFYVLGAIILILAASHFKTAAGALAVFLVSSWITTGYIAWSNNHMPSIEDPLALFDKIYDKPWTRLGPYLIGMAAGWLLFKTDCKLKMSKAVVLIGWTLSVVVLLCLVYGLYDSELSPITAAAYTSLSHTAWAMCIAWIVVACSTGYGGYVNSLLSATILYPFSRVTYCAYLVHPIVIRFLPMHMDHPIHLGKDMMTIIFLGQMVSSYLLSFIISLAFEAPVVTMLKILAPNKRKKLQ